jgi:hypothetical protein
MKTLRLSLTTVAFAVSLLPLAQCRRQEVPRSEVAPTAAGGSRAVAPPSDARAVAADGATDAGADAGGPLPSAGEWLDGRIYRFRLEASRRCGPAANPDSLRIGVVVRVESKMDELLVAARDVKLQSGGIILDSLVIAKAPAGCAPLLAPSSLRAKKATAGAVIFDVPPEIVSASQPVRVVYQPTRWGGAHRVEAALPPGALKP